MTVQVKRSFAELKRYCSRRNEQASNKRWVTEPINRCGLLAAVGRFHHIATRLSACRRFAITNSRRLDNRSSMQRTHRSAGETAVQSKVRTWEWWWLAGEWSMNVIHQPCTPKYKPMAAPRNAPTKALATREIRLIRTRCRWLMY